MTGMTGCRSCYKGQNVETKGSKCRIKRSFFVVDFYYTFRGSVAKFENQTSPL